MTIETRGTVRFNDIKAIEYECPSCHATTVRKLDEKHNVPARCGNCHQSWFSDGSREHSDLSELINILRNFPKMSINEHVIVKLEIDGIAKKSIESAASRDSGGEA